MDWARMLAFITGTVDQELLLRNEYLVAENRILRAQINGRLLLSDAGYARVSSASQNLDAQMDALKQAECAKTFTDKDSIPYSCILLVAGFSE